MFNLVLLIITLINLISTNHAVRTNYCCEGVNILINRKCPTGKPINLNCTRRYLLDPNLDEYESFEISSDGNLLYPTPLNLEKKVIVEPEYYCLTKLETENSTEVAILCTESYESLSDGKWFGLRAICGFVSVIFLIATLGVYVLVPNLRDLQGKCIMHVLLCLGLSFLILGIVQFSTSIDKTICIISSLLIYLSFMTTFFWLNITSFHVWRTVIFPKLGGDDKYWYILYNLYGYGTPLTLMIILVIAHHVPGDHIKPGLAQSRCWFEGLKETMLYFYSPVFLLLCINLVLFTWCMIVLYRSKKMPISESEIKLKSYKYKVSLYTKLFFVMGFLWFFEVLSAAFENVHENLNFFWSITDYVNALQGVMIFLILVVFRKRALRGLANKRILCIRFPHTWKSLENEELINEDYEDNTRLSTEDL